MIIKTLFSLLTPGQQFLIDNQNDRRILRKVEIKPGNTGHYMVATRPIRGYLDEATNSVELTGSDFIVLIEAEDI